MFDIKLLFSNMAENVDIPVSAKKEPKSIKLPHTVEIFSNLKNAKRFAIDIGKFLFTNLSVSAAFLTVL